MSLLTRLTPFTRSAAVPAALLIGGGVLAVAMPAASSQAAGGTTLCKEQTLPVAGHSYTVENNEWGSSAPECISTDGSAGFTVANSSIANSTYGAPGGYAAIYKGCHWGACTPGSGFPIQVSDIRPGKVTTTWSTSQPGGSSDYDVAYDIWFNQTPTTTGQPNGTELMIWLNHNGPVQPFGAKVASNVSVGGRGYDVWFGNQGWNTLSYTMTSGTTSVSNLDLQPLIADAVSRGYIKPSWYLIDVEAGFEMWQGGQGLATKSFSVNATGGGTSAASPATTSPASPPSPSATATSAAPTSPAPSSPAPSSPAPTSPPPASPPPASPASQSPLAVPARLPDISLQAISPDPPASGNSTNITLDYKNLGPAVAANLTLVTQILNSAGAVVGSQSQSSQNVASQETLNTSYAWTAAPEAGTYTIEGLVQDSAGKTLEHVQVGTVTVK
jgi:Glycosyl hydrolase family 12